jgi:hypothetical protein
MMMMQATRARGGIPSVGRYGWCPTKQAWNERVTATHDSKYEWAAD